MIFTNKLKGSLEFVSLKWVLMIVVSSFYFNASAQIFFFVSDDIGATGQVTLAADISCSGFVQYRLWSNRRLRNVRVNYNNSGFNELHTSENVVSQGGSPHTSSEYPQNVNYTWPKTYANENPNAFIELNYEYRNSFGSWCSANCEFTSLSYGHTGSNPPFTVSFSSQEISPNNYEFTYTGTPVSGGSISSYSFVFDMDNGQAAITGTNSLVSGSIIGTSAVNPNFYCRANVSGANALTVNPILTVTPTYSISGQTGNGTSSLDLQCPVPSTQSIVLDDLCTLFSGYSVNNIASNEFSSQVTSSSSGNSILDGMVDDISVSVSGQGTVSGISGPGQTANYNFPSGQYQNYNLTETITIEPGCVCQDVLSYNTANPCFNLSDITATQSFENGEYVYTFSLSDYAGGAPNTYTITSVIVDFGDGTSTTFDPYVPGTTISHSYPDDGAYTVTQTVVFNNGQFEPCISSLTFGAETYCCINFAPEPEERYWVSAWVKEIHTSQQKTYENTLIELSFDDGTIVQLRPSGDIIEGWQRIVGEFNIPAAATDMQIDLVNESNTIEAYFDDVRVHPFNASMKSYVYDPETLWLTAELDDNNYATFYEYDKEGQLIRIKKETARGIMTIQESRNSNPKSE